MRRAFLALALAGASLGSLPAAQGLSAAQKDANNLEQKLALLLQRGSQPRAANASPLRTSLSDREVNAYLQLQGRQHLPVGLIDPALTIVDNSRVEARAIVDLDAVRQAKERTWSDPLSWVSGRVEIKAAGRLHAVNGVGALTLDTATLGGVPIPKSLLQELVSYYSRTPESPKGFDLDAPFNLPHQIRQVDLRPGAAVIVQ